MERKKIIVGNWKMYKTIEESIKFIDTLAPLVENSQAHIYLAVPFTLITEAVKALDRNSNNKIIIGAQNMNDASEGAFTGEIAGKMLKDAGAKFVILGHSERRHLFSETDHIINKKVKRALQEELQPILCIGETLEQRESEQTQKVLEEQLYQSLEGISDQEFSQLIIAYEPVWAIGTGKTATPQIAQETHQWCRIVIRERWGEEIAEKVSLLYGGSVKPNNAKQIMEQSDIDGLLVGGASLDPQIFSTIINFKSTVVS